MSKRSDELHIKLSKIVGADRVRTDKLERLLHNHDLAPLPPLMEMGFTTSGAGTAFKVTLVTMPRVPSVPVNRSLRLYAALWSDT